jgi:hypothetical protein
MATVCGLLVISRLSKVGFSSGSIGLSSKEVRLTAVGEAVLQEFAAMASSHLERLNWRSTLMHLVLNRQMLLLNEL